MIHQARNFVITRSILIEQVVSATLAAMLNIDLRSSKALNRHVGAISFGQKLDLLTDIKLLDKSAQLKFEKFAEVRNQFAHNFFLTDFTSCFAQLKGAENYLRRTYPEKKVASLDHENQLKALYDGLYYDITKQVFDLFNSIVDKFVKTDKVKYQKSLYESLIKVMQDEIEANPALSKVYDQIIAKAVETFESSEEPV